VLRLLLDTPIAAAVAVEQQQAVALLDRYRSSSSSTVSDRAVQQQQQQQQRRRRKQGAAAEAPGHVQFGRFCSSSGQQLFTAQQQRAPNTIGLKPLALLRGWAFTVFASGLEVVLA
jgi:hypothetical protein